MEFPHLGENCSSKECNKLDFLPVKCDGCSKIFCKDHYSYASHHCQSSHMKDNQVPVCPLCNRPVSILKNDNIDEVVSRHIDNDCKSDLALNKRLIYNRRCSMKNCKQKEMVQVNCSKCRLNYCLRHRNVLDHDCKGFENSGRLVTNSGAATILRIQKEKNSKTQNKASKDDQTRVTALKIHSLQQPTLSEDEALQKALQLSLQNSHIDLDERLRQEEEDANLARIIQESELSVMQQRNDSEILSNEERSNCTIS